MEKNVVKDVCLIKKIIKSVKMQINPSLYDFFFFYVNNNFEIYIAV